MALFYNVVDIACYNAYVLYNILNPNINKGKSHRRRLFLLALGRELAGIPEAEVRSSGAVQPIQRIAEQQARGRCRLCGWQKDRKSSLVCHKCGYAVCKEHSVSVCAECIE